MKKGRILYSMKIGTLFDIDIYINGMLVVVLAIAIFTGNGTKITTIFLVILIHEMAHVLMARVLHLKVREIELLPFGGSVRIEGLFELNPRNEVLIALAGPMANIILIFGYISLQNLGMLSEESDNFFIMSNLVLAGFNLVPALPLDGGRVLRSLLSKELGFKRSTYIAVNAGVLLAMFLIAVGIYSLFYKIFNATIFFTAFFLIYSAMKEKRAATYVFLRDITYKKDILLKEGSLLTKNLIVLYSTTLKDIINKFTPHYYHYVQVVDEQMRLKGSLSENQILNGLIEFGINAPVIKILNKLE